MPSENFDLNVNVDVTGAEDVQKLEAQIGALTDATVEVPISVDDEATDVVTGIAETVGELDGAEAEIAVAVDDEATDVVTEVADTVGELDGAEAEITVSADDNASDDLDDVQSLTDDIDGSAAEVTVEADDNASDTLDDVQSLTDDIDGTVAEVTVEADTEAAQEGLVGVGEAAGGLTDGLGPLTGALDALNGNFATLAGPAGAIGAVVAALGQATASAYEFTQQVDELSGFTGAAAEESSALLATLQAYTGVSLSELEGSIARVADKLASTPALARQLGIDVANAKGPLDLYVQAVDALNSSQLSATDRISVGLDVFGRKGVKAINDIATSLSGSLADAMAAVPDELIVTQDDIAASDALEASLGQLKLTIRGVAQEVGEQLIPQMTLLAQAAAPIVGAYGDVAAATLDTLSPLNEIQALWRTFVDDGKDVEKSLQGVNDAMVALQPPAERFPEVWGQIVADLADGHADLEATATGLDMISTATGATIPQLVAMAEAESQMADATAESAPSMEELNRALAEHAQIARAADQNWGILLDDLADGTIDTQNAADAWNILQEALGLTDEQMQAMVASKLAAKMKEDGEAATEFAHSIEDLNRAAAESAQIALATDQNWGILLADLADGAIDTQAAADAYNILQNALGLTDEKMQALVAQKLDQKLKDEAAAAEEAAKAQREHAAAIQEAADAISDINADDLDNITAGLEDALTATEGFLGHLSFAEDLQHEFDDALKEADRFGPDLRELLDLQAQGVTITPDITLGELESDDSEFLAWAASLQQMVHKGAVEAFTTGGKDSANAFVEAQAQAFLAANPTLTLADFYNLMGLPADGTIDTLIQTQIDKEAASDAIATLKALQGVNPDDPILAYIAAEVQTGSIDPVIAEIASLLLAQKYGIDVDAQLAEFTPDQIGQAQAQVDAAGGVIVPSELEPPDTSFFDSLWTEPVTVPVETEPGASFAGTTRQLDTMVEPRTADIDVKADNAGAINRILDDVAEDRDTHIAVHADNAGTQNAVINSVARDRDAHIYAVAYTAGAEAALNNTARSRTSTVTQNVNVHTTRTSSVGGGDRGSSSRAAPAGVSATAAMVPAAQASPTPVVVSPQITINAAVIGNRYDVARTVSNAVRSALRLNGSRLVGSRS